MMNWKSLMGQGLLAIAGLNCALAVEAEDGSGWYFGAGVGRSDAKRTTSWGQLADATRSINGVSGNTVIGSHDTAWKIFAGYQLNQNFALEGAYTDLGRFNGATVINAPAAATASGKWDASSPLNVAAVGILPIWNRFSVLGKAGLALTKLSVSLSSPAAANLSATRTQLLLGAGLKYDFTKAFAVRGEFERFNNVGDGSNTGQTAIDVWSISAQYRFYPALRILHRVRRIAGRGLESTPIRGRRDFAELGEPRLDREARALVLNGKLGNLLARIKLGHEGLVFVG